ncbi:MAG: hypothetical protein CME64_03900 [Halobacteriovoraceae bacterium]|nr:hypothetical protein [Halobacteriovoraceae bacterium]|tara:strand:+ start:56624 stop:58045 length:1422 start_codon:yes stop_codon:yes gene_type:complete
MLKKDHKEVLDIISEVERPALTSLKSCGIHIWPLIRYQIIQSQWNETRNKLSNKDFLDQNHTFISDYKSYYLEAKFKFKLGRYLQRFYQSKNIIFFYRQEELQIDSKGQKVSTIGEGVCSYFKTLGESAETLKLDDADFLELFEIKFQINLKRIFHQVKKEQLFEMLLEVFTDKEKSTLRLDFNWIFNDIVYIQTYFELYVQILRILKPKCIFYTVFYHPKSMALALAGRSLKITTTEVQHGLNGTYCPLEGHYKYIPEEGYNILPNCFWQWDQGSVLRKGCFSSIAKVMNLGHPAFQYFKNVAHSPSYITRHKTIILVALQPGDDPIPKLIMDLINDRSLSSFQWLIRTHPRAHPLDSKLVEELNTKENVEVESPSKEYLATLLVNCDIFISKWSTILVEAALYGKQSIAIHPNALNMMEDAIKNKLIQFASDPESLKLLLRTPKPNSQPKPNAAQSDHIISTLRKEYLCAE